MIRDRIRNQRGANKTVNFHRGRERERERGGERKARTRILGGIPSLILTPAFLSSPVTYGNLTDLTTTPVRWSLFRVATIRIGANCENRRQRRRRQGTTRNTTFERSIAPRRRYSRRPRPRPRRRHTRRRVSISRNALSRTSSSRMEPSERHADDF